MSDKRILELALAAAQQERDPQQPLLLLLSMSAMDVLGHTFGPSSWEAWDHLRRLDASLATFLTSLEATVGPAGVILSGDHGNSAMPEARVPLPAYCNTDEARSDAYDRPFCAAGARLEPNALRAELRAAVARSMGRSDLIAGVSDGYVFLTRAARALELPQRDALDRVVRGVLAQHAAEIAEVFHVGELASRCPRVLAGARGIPDRARPGEDLITLVCRSWADGAGAGDYFVVPAYGCFFDGEVVQGKGASHGTPWLYDRTVPLFVRAPGAIDAGGLVVDPVDFSAYAALEAALLGLDPRPAREILDALRAR